MRKAICAWCRRSSNDQAGRQEKVGLFVRIFGQFSSIFAVFSGIFAVFSGIFAVFSGIFGEDLEISSRFAQIFRISPTTTS